MVKLSAVIDALELKVMSPPKDLDIMIETACVSDLLSHVMATCPGNSLWITAQGHSNVIGVASLLDMQAVLLAGGSLPDENVVSKATEAGVALLWSKHNAFDICGKLYNLGIRGPLTE